MRQVVLVVKAVKVAKAAKAARVVKDVKALVLVAHVADAAVANYSYGCCFASIAKPTSEAPLLQTLMILNSLC